MSSLLSMFLGFVFVEQLHGEVGINANFSAILIDCWLQEGVFVFLGGLVADVEVFFNPSDAVDEASGLE